MGLDSVEIVLRTEEVFAIDLPDDECACVRTVGDLYRLVLSKLQLPYQSPTEIEAETSGRSRAAVAIGTLLPWTTPDVWQTLKAIIEDQLQVSAAEVLEDARFNEDLRCD